MQLLLMQLRLRLLTLRRTTPRSQALTLLTLLTLADAADAEPQLAPSGRRRRRGLSPVSS